MKMKLGAFLALFVVAGMAVGCDEHQLSGCGPNDKPAPTPAPAPSRSPGISCNSNPDNWVPSPDRRGPTRLAEVQSAAEAVQRSLPELFNGNRLVGECHASANVFFAALTKELRARGLCAWPGPDAIHPASTVQGIAEEYHIITYGGCTLYPATRNNYKGDWIIR